LLNKLFENSIVFQINEKEESNYIEIIDELKKLNNYYEVKSKPGVNKTDFTDYCVNISESTLKSA